MVSGMSTAASGNLLHECRTWRQPRRAVPPKRPAKRQNDFADKALREGLPSPRVYDGNQSERGGRAANVTKAYELPRNFAPVIAPM
jgi:hypothetical protein